MKKYLVIGNPIEHSLSPVLHNYWIKKHNLEAIYEKQKLDDHELKEIILKIKQKKINGINVTVPFKKKVIQYLDHLTPEASNTQSVNTINFINDKVVGHNTDIEGFEQSIIDANFDLEDKKVFILGAGGVVPSLVYALNRKKVSQIFITNRTREHATGIKNQFNNCEIVDWGQLVNFDMIINATSIGLKKGDKIDLNFSDVGKNKFFFDVIYNPTKTNFLKQGDELGNKTENGKKMFIYQAAAAFKIWHGIQPIIDENLIKFLEND